MISLSRCQFLLNKAYIIHQLGVTIRKEKAHEWYQNVSKEEKDKNSSMVEKCIETLNMKNKSWLSIRKITKRLKSAS